MNPTVRSPLPLASGASLRSVERKTADASGLFFNSAVRTLAAGRLNMDVPISVGVVLALGMSVFETLQQSTHVYFDFALMLLTLLLVGRTLEQAMRRRTGAAAGNFVALRGETLTKFVSDTELAEVPAASVAPGDLVLARRAHCGRRGGHRGPVRDRPESGHRRDAAGFRRERQHGVCRDAQRVGCVAGQSHHRST